MKNVILVYALVAMFFVARDVVPVQNKSFSTRQSTPKSRVIAERRMSLAKRYNDTFVNDVFRKNILLTMSYLKGEVSSSKAVNWKNVDKPFTYNLTLKPNEVFAFHNDVLLPEYTGKVDKTIGVSFNSYEGFLSDGYLVGDGVCHLASLMNWAARDAGLEVVSPTNHDFANIPEVPRKYGVSIYSTSAAQNLYIKNTRKSEVVMKFAYDGVDLRLVVEEAS